MSLIQPVKYEGSHMFAVFVPVLLTLCMLPGRFEGFRTFLYVVTSIVQVPCAKNYG